MIAFLHPEYLKFLWAIPFFVLFYGLVSIRRKRIAMKKGLPLPAEQDDSKFTITNGWFITSVFSLVYAILIVGIAAPCESEESRQQYDSKKIQIMLAFDPLEDGQLPVASINAVKKELDTLHTAPLDVQIGALATANPQLMHMTSRSFPEISNYLKTAGSTMRGNDHYMVKALNNCTAQVKWESTYTKRSIVIFSQREHMDRDEIDAAKKAVKAAAKQHIFTYIVGQGKHVDSPDLQEIASAGKGAYIDAGERDASLYGLIHLIKQNHRLTFVEVLNYILMTIFFLVTPSLAIFLCKKYSWLGKLGPIMVLYGVGMLLGSVKINGTTLFPNELGVMQNILSTAMVPLAIPLMLFSCTFNKNEIGKHFKAMITGLVGVVGAVVLGYFLCRDHVQDANKVAGMLTGVYTGGTINMAAIKESLQADNQSYILIQTYDIVICLAYLIFLLLGGFKIFRKWMKFDNSEVIKKKGKKHKLTPEELADRERLEEELKIEEQGFSSIFTTQGFINTLVLFGVTLGLVAVSAGLTLLVSGGQLNMTIFFLLITTFGILCSYIKTIHNRRQHYNLGLYCIYVFSLVIATMADFNSLKDSLTTDIWMPTFVFFAVFGSLFLSAILGKIFKVDADTMVITSVAYINSPAFVPMIAGAMRNRKVLIPGLTIGVIGFAVGNYLGTFLAYILP